MISNRALLFAIAVGAAAVFAFLAPIAAATTLSEIRFTPDVTLTIGSTNATVSARKPGIDDVASPGAVTLLDLGALPSDAQVVATHQTVTGSTLFVLDTTAQLGTVQANPRRVIEYNGSAYSLYFDAALHGVPASAQIDALALIDDTDLLLSFDIHVLLPGGVLADPRDLVRFSVSGDTWTKFFDGAAAGVPNGLNLQDVHFFDHNRHLLMTFDGAGTLGGVTFGPDSVLEFTPPGDFALAYDGSTRDNRWNAAGSAGDLVALHARSYRSVLDIDANSQFDPNTDGLLVMRHMFGYANPMLTLNAMGVSPAPLRNAASIPGYFLLVDAFLDVDGNGTADGLTDGLMIVRYLQGMRGPAVTQGLLGNGAVRTSAQVESFIKWLTQ